ncbi:hypothetical protein [Gemmatimonas sp.]|jgi:hypothetical protein|uniref:hypothetical protein n=1 Tax=Gemmatimonas sp. TaxID=1962908 RepID=UPI0037BF7566
MNTSTPPGKTGVTPRVLYVLAAVLVVSGAVLLLLPVGETAPSSLTVLPADSTPFPANRRADSNAVRMVRANLFSATRQAPRSRFVLPGEELTPDFAMLPTAPVVSDDVALQGVMTLDGVARALIRFPGADSVPKLVQVGDRVSGYRVRRIGADRVELSSSAGTRTVRLLRRVPSDSGEPELR